MWRLLNLWIACLRAFGKRADARVESRQLFPQRVEFRLLAEDDLAELFEVMLQMGQQKFDVRESVFGGGHCGGV